MSDATELHRTEVDLKGLLEVLGKNLYSTPAVALRELVQNAHDACVRRRIEAPSDEAPVISVTTDRAKRTLIIEDSGAGLTREEIMRYLTTVGAGYTRRLRGESASKTKVAPDLIGAFGLGFLSSFFVSDKVEVETTSYQEPEVGWRFESRGAERYQLSSIAARAIGTRVTLHLSEDLAFLADPDTVRALLGEYCPLLPFRVFLNGEAKPINLEVLPWREQRRDRRLELEIARRFERSFEPITTLPVPDGGPLRGILWIQDGSTYGSSDNRNLSVFVRGMLITKEARELLPGWAGFIGGVVESNELRPTASREDLMKDEVFEAAAEQLDGALLDGLVAIAKAEPETWRRVLLRHNEALRGAALCEDRLFELLADALKLPTSEGELTVPAIKKRSEGKLYVSMGDEATYEQVLFRALRLPVVIGTRYAAASFAEAHTRRFGGAIVPIGTRKGDRQVFDPVELPAADVARLEALFGGPDRAVVPARFRPPWLPLVLVPDREAELKARIEADEADKRISSAALGLARLYTARIAPEVRARLYANVESPVIQALLKSEGPPADRAARLLRSLAALMAPAGEDAKGEDLASAIEDYARVVLELLEPRPAGAEAG